MSIEITSQGVRKHYGPRTSEKVVPSTVHVEGGSLKELRLNFDFSSLPLTPDGNQNAADDILAQFVPGGSFVTEAYLEVGDAWIGGTSLDIGYAQQDGTTIDVDGLFDATELITANLTAGALFSSESGTGTDLAGSSGAPVQPHATADSYIEIVQSGTYTAGSATLVVRYRPPVLG